MKSKITYPKPCAKCQREIKVDEWATAGEKLGEFICSECSEPTFEEADIPY